MKLLLLSILIAFGIFLSSQGIKPSPVYADCYEYDGYGYNGWSCQDSYPEAPVAQPVYCYYDEYGSCSYTG